VGISLLTLVPGEVGGAETSARGLCRGLADVGTLDYAAFTPPAAPQAGEGIPEVPVPEYRLARSVPERAFAMALAAARPGRLRRRFAGLDAVHYPLTIALPSLEIPTAVTVHDLQHLDHPELFSRAERLFRARTHEGSARKADAVIVPSQFVRRRTIELLGIPPERVHAIPWGVDHQRFHPGDDQREPFLLYPARPWPHKNHARLFEAFALLRDERPELRLVLTGGGHEGRPVPPGVDVRGLVSGDELASLYRRTACLVFPSLYEGFGQPPLEAMASGAPVAASNIPAIAEAAGEAAALFEPTEPEDIAAVVSGVLDAPERFAAAGLERAAGFTWAETARRHEAVYVAAGAT
jgi:glycosyltransferase involved in cell wall biosynthesis